MLIAALVWGGTKLVDWYSSRRPSRDGCFFITQRDRGELCVRSRDLGRAISPESLDKIDAEHPALFCGEPLKAAEFIHLAGGRLCAQTDVRPGAVFEPP